MAVYVGYALVFSKSTRELPGNRWDWHLVAPSRSAYIRFNCANDRMKFENPAVRMVGAFAGTSVALSILGCYASNSTHWL